MAKFRFKVPKKRRGAKKRKTRALGIEKVESMFDLYCKEYPIDQIAEELGISHATVAKYINRGDPSREIEPLKTRRARIVQAAMSVQDGQLLRRLSNLQVFSNKLLASSGGRLLERIAASEELDKEVVYAPGNELKRVILERKALEPEVKDVQAIMGMNTELLDMAARMSGLTHEQPGVQVTVTQGQHQSTIQEVTNADPEAMEQVYSYMARANKNVAGHGAVTRMVRDASLALEGESEVIEEQSPNPSATEPPDGDVG